MPHAIRQHAFGDPEELVLEEVAELIPGPGQVRIAVQAAGVHLLDTTIRAGTAGGPFGLPELPMTPGREVAGAVDAVGPDVDEAWVGRRVVAHLGMASGGYASQAVAPVEAIIPLADHVAATDAVAMVGTGRTTLGVLEEAAITADDVVLVTAAAGGIGNLLVQAAVEAGATVVGAAGGPEKVALVRSLGAGIAVDYSAQADPPAAAAHEVRSGGDPVPRWPAEVQRRLGDRRVTVALDGVGGAIGRAAFELVAPGGRVVLFGYSAGEPMALSADDLFSSGVVVGAAIGPRMFARPGGIHALAVEAVERLAAGRWRPVVHPPFALADAAEAHRAIAGRGTTGKVVLVP